LGETRGRKSNEQTLVQTIVFLIRNTTWRCGKLEKSIVKHLYKRHENFGKPGVSVKEIMTTYLSPARKKTNALMHCEGLRKEIL